GRARSSRAAPARVRCASRARRAPSFSSAAASGSSRRSRTRPGLTSASPRASRLPVFPHSEIPPRVCRVAHTIFANGVILLASKLICLTFNTWTAGTGSAATVQEEMDTMLRISAIGTLVAVMTPVMASNALAAPAATKDIVDTAVAAGSFTTLAKALTAADLVGTLKGPGPFTVFAPTDEAFAKLPPGTLESLLKPENKAKLQKILTYHVVAGKVMAADVTKLHSAKTVEGAMLNIQTDAKGVKINNAHVIKADIVASNGVIHVIDTVLLPE